MLQLRQVAETDHGYIISTFLHTVDKSKLGVPPILLAGLMSGCLVRWSGWIACDSETPSEIIGYVVYKPKTNVVGWLYIRAGFRGKHVGHMLLLAATPSTDIVSPFGVGSCIDTDPKRLIRVKVRPLQSLT